MPPRTSDDYYFNWWGGNLQGRRRTTRLTSANIRTSLFTRRTTMVRTSSMSSLGFEGSYTYESLMKDCWHDNWFYIQEEDIAPLLIGEWGGFMTEPNLTLDDLHARSSYRRIMTESHLLVLQCELWGHRADMVLGRFRYMGRGKVCILSRKFSGTRGRSSSDLTTRSHLEIMV